MKCKKGDLVEITFDDHAEGTDHFNFVAYGQVVSQNKKSIVLTSWRHEHTTEVSALDPNVIVHTILKSTITKLRVLNAS